MSRSEISWFQGSAKTELPPLPPRIDQGRMLRAVVPGMFSIAPMIDKTNRHFRWYLRQLTKQAILYTEMITSAAIIRGKRNLLLDFDQVERPLVLQLGGDNPKELAEAVRIAEDWGYDEYNLNVGCPSDKVQKGSFGACLMATPDKVAAMVATIAEATKKPITVKHRVGIAGFGYHQETFEEMVDFVRVVASAGCERFIVHARMAMLEGLSPKENRSIPPIRYEDVYQLKNLYPNLHVEINGQVRTMDAVRAHLEKNIDGIMIGRASYETPQFIAELDTFEKSWPLTPDKHPIDRFQIVRNYAEYIDKACEVGLGISPRALIWPILEMFPTIRGSRKYKQVLSDSWHGTSRVSERVNQALSHLETESVPVVSR